MCRPYISAAVPAPPGSLLSSRRYHAISCAAPVALLFISLFPGMPAADLDEFSCRAALRALGSDVDTRVESPGPQMMLEWFLPAAIHWLVTHITWAEIANRTAEVFSWSPASSYYEGLQKALKGAKERGLPLPHRGRTESGFRRQARPHADPRNRSGPAGARQQSEIHLPRRPARRKLACGHQIVARALRRPRRSPTPAARRTSAKKASSSTRTAKNIPRPITSSSPAAAGSTPTPPSMN